jgi:hypothetical protein
MMWFVLAVAVVLFGGALFVDRARSRGPLGGSGAAGHPDDPESHFFNPYDTH